MVAFDTMKDKLLTLEEAQARLSETEPLNQTHVHSGSKIAFEFHPQWSMNLDNKEGTDTVDATISVAGTEHVLSKDAALQAGAAFGLPGKYASRVPNNFLQDQLNYWFSAGLGDREFNMLTTGSDQRVAAFTRPTINPFSNTLLVGEVIQGIVQRYGSSDIYVDYKFNHSLIRTSVRFIIPEAVRVITGGGMGDVPSGQADEWAGGVHLSNSLIGKSQTKLETYLFRWWCTNGATSVMEDVGAWSRRGEQDTQDVYEWAAEAVDEVLGGLEQQFDRVQALTNLNVAGNVADVVGDLFDRYRVPVAQRQDVLDTLVEAENLTLYTIMNSITQTANDPELSADRVDKLLRIGGDIPNSTFNSQKAKIFNEGQVAGPDSPNPYQIQVL